MANKVTGWEGSGTRPGSRRRVDKAGKGTVYWIDLSQEKDDLFEAFASFHGMEKRDAAKALMAVAMGLLPAGFWEPSSEGGFTGAERTNLIRQVFPKGSGHTNRAPHAVWKSTWDGGNKDADMRGAPGGISWMGLLIEKEKLRLKEMAEGKRGLERMRPGLQQELIEQEYHDSRRFAEEQIRILEETRRQRLLERGVILPEGGEVGSDGHIVGTGSEKSSTDNSDDDSGRPTVPRAGSPRRLPVDRIALPAGDENIDPFERERKKNAAAIARDRTRVNPPVKSSGIGGGVRQSTGGVRQTGGGATRGIGGRPKRKKAPPPQD